MCRSSPIPELASLFAFALICLGMVLTPGPNMVYLISRSICQGRMAGLISLGGVALGFMVYMFCAALGGTALVMAVPYAYDALRLAGALYLLCLAWQSVKPGGRSPFQVRDLPKHSPRKLFMMGFITSLLNPKIAVMYLSLLPQFIAPEGHGSVLAQSLILGTTQIIVSVSINALIVLMAGGIAVFRGECPLWQVLQRWLAGLAMRMLAEGRRGVVVRRISCALRLPVKLCIFRQVSFTSPDLAF